VSPTLAIAPTNQEYEGYVGLKGKLANNISFNVKGSFNNEENKALYQSNGYDFDNANQKGYTFGNSFNVVYDDVKTFSLYGELKADFSKNVSFGVNGLFNGYSTNEEEEAWNLPAVKITSALDVAITEKWSAGASLFYVGERKDQFKISYLLDLPENQPYPKQDVTLAGYVDLNANVEYKFSDRWNFFLKGNNLTNKNYERWTNYPVQGIQVLAGATYKFDF
jgi:outer membrane receptor protein involved in Fe transport